MVDLKALALELAFARRARREAEMAGFDIERVIERMQAGRTLQQIALEELMSADAPAPAAISVVAVDAVEYRQAA